MSFRYLSPIFIVLMVIGCSTISPGGGISPLTIEVDKGPRAVMDPEVEKASSAYHYYLTGQLSLVEEEFESALARFQKASELLDSPAPLVNIRLAELYIRSGKLKEALQESKKALEAQPDNVQFKLLHAGILESLNRNKEAVVIYKEVVAAQPESGHLAILLATVYLKERRYAESIELLSRVAKKNPEDASINYFLGRSYELNGNLVEAERLLSKSFEENKNSSIGVELVRVLIKGSKFEEAKAICADILEREPGNVVARRVLGQLLIGENRLDEALRQLRVLETIEEDAVDTRFKIALIQIEKQNFVEAVRELNLVLAKKPDHAKARYYLGSIYAGSGRRKDAILELYKIKPGQEMFVKSRSFAAFVLRQDGKLKAAEKAVREALSEKKNDTKLLVYLVLILRDQDNLKAARTELRAALDKHPDNEHFLFNYAIVLHDLKQEQESLLTMKRVIELNPRNTNALNYVAYSYAESGDNLEKGLELIKQALSIRPNDGYFLDTLGWIYFRLGKYSKAEQHLSRAVELTDDDPVIIEHLADCLLKLDKRRAALQKYRLAISKAQDGQDKDDSENKDLVSRLEKKVSALQEGQLREKIASQVE